MSRSELTLLFVLACGLAALGAYDAEHSRPLPVRAPPVVVVPARDRCQELVYDPWTDTYGCKARP